MSELHTATLIADADLADTVEFPVRLTGTAGLLRATFAKIRTWLVDTDNTLAANSNLKVASQAAIKAYIANKLIGMLDLRGATDCSANPNYPAATKGDYYIVTVAGKIGGAAGTAVLAGDAYFATADNAGGTQAAVGASWDTLVHTGGTGGATTLDALTDVDTSTVAPINNDVLTYETASSLWKPKAASGGAAGALVLLEQHTAANVASLDFTAISATYDEYLFEMVNLLNATDSAVPWLRMSTDGGVTFDSGANYNDYWHSRSIATFSGNGGATDTRITMNNNGHSKLYNIGINGQFRLFQPLSTTMYKGVNGAFQACDGGPSPGWTSDCQFSGWYRSLTAVNALRFLFSTGNITSGTIRMYGIAK